MENLEEYKKAVYDRLWREGRWPEAEAFKKARMDELRKVKPKIRNLDEVAWKATDDRFPPYPDDWVPPPKEKVEKPPEPVPSAPLPIVNGGSVDEAWPDLPPSTDPYRDAMWAYNYAGVIVKDREGASSTIHWDRAPKPPSLGVDHWIKMRVRDFKDYRDKMAKFTSGVDGDGDLEKKERRSIQEISDLLERMQLQ